VEGFKSVCLNCRKTFSQYKTMESYLCTTTVVLGWTQDEHFLEDDLLLDSGFGSSITKMGPQMECWVGGCTGRTLPCIQSLQGTALVLVIDGAPTPHFRSCNSQQPHCFKVLSCPIDDGPVY
jgi:hypothetical protein